MHRRRSWRITSTATSAGSPEIRDDEAWARRLTLLPGVDFALYRSYRPRPGAPWRLGAAITGFAGDQDQVVPPADMVS
ncbi:hypothetical protein ABZ883_34660 [Streptomyces sp. NPDC046977]|uniref:hypothetical protein n=1 Tax=Streptomyces sp. NPDC046977 TaxID=3154703 RepID=UPI00341078F1